MNRWIQAAALLLAVVSLSGCGKKPEATVPTFDPATVETVAAKDKKQPEAAVIQVTRSEEFQNKSGLTDFQVALDMALTEESMGVKEVKPWKPTGEDAKAILEALLPGARCYESHPKYVSWAERQSREELEEKLARWRSYSYEDIVEIYGGEENMPVASGDNGEDLTFQEYWERDMQYFEELLQKLPEGYQPPLCQWELFKETEYMVEPEEAARMDLSHDRDCIMGSVEQGDREYLYVVASGDGKSAITLSESNGSSPVGIDWFVIQKERSKLPAPTQEQMEAVRAKAETLLQNFPMGKLTLSGEGTLEETYNLICFEARLAESALPENAQLAQGGNGGETPRIGMRFYPDGTLAGFWCYNGENLVEQQGEAKRMPVETLLDAGLEALKQSEAEAWGIHEIDLATAKDWLGVELRGKVTVTELVWSYTRMKTPGETWVYVPCLTLRGTVVYSDPKTGKTYQKEDMAFLPEGVMDLVTVNAIDGTILPAVQ